MQSDERADSLELGMGLTTDEGSSQQHNLREHMPRYDCSVTTLIPRKLEIRIIRNFMTLIEVSHNHVSCFLFRFQSDRATAKEN